MKKQKICVIGDGLSGLTTTLMLKNLNLDIDVFYKKSNTKKIVDKRATALSVSNYKFLKNNINLKRMFFWKCNEINLYYEENKKYSNFLNFEKNKEGSMYIFENNKLKNFLFKELDNYKNIKKKHSYIKKIDHKECSIKIKNKKFYYDLIIMCLGGKSHLYENIRNNRSINKNYKEVSITASIKHSGNIYEASQFFLKEGPLAILPYNKKEFSIVWSLDKKFYEKSIKTIKNIIEDKLKLTLGNKLKFNISNTTSFPIHLNLQTQYHKNNVLVLGEGVHSIHPIAGQGFNLIIRDIKKIIELIKKNMKLGLTLKNSYILEELSNSRKPENIIFGLGIDFVNIFFKQNKMLEPLKSFMLNNIHKSKQIIKVSKKISDTGLL